MNKYICNIVFLFTLVSQVNAQDLLPFVENITKANYEGDNQVWSSTQGDDNAMYFANNHYFLRYNGVVWEKYMLPNKTIIRSVFADKEKIFTGSYNEFGYWERISGVMRYFSLSKKSLFFGESTNEEIWKILKFKGNIYFQSFNQVFVYDGKKVTKLNLPSQISYCFFVHGKLYVASVNKGIYTYENGTFITNPKWLLLENNIIHSIEYNTNKTYFFTRKNGVFVDENGILKPWNSVLNTALKSELINTARFIDNDRLAIGTAFKGLYIVDIKNDSFININRNNSLKNNSVLSIGFDKENDLWLGMDNGISHIEINSPYKSFVDNTGILGTLYSIAPTDSGYLLGSNHGVFKYGNKKLDFVAGSQGQVWQIDKVGSKYSIGHNDGTFIYDRSLHKINDINGGWKVLKNNYNATYFQANYSGIVVYSDESFTSYNRIEKLTKPIKNIAQISKNELWAVDNYKSLYKIEFDENQKAKKILNVTRNNGIKNDFNVKLFTFKNEMLFYINGTWYKHNSVTNKLELSILFNKSFRAISGISTIDADRFLIIKDGLFYIIDYENNEFIWNLIPKKYYEGKSINEETKVLKQGKQIVINTDDGFFIYRLENRPQRKQIVSVEGFYNSSLITDQTTINFNHSVTLHVITPYYGFNKAHLFYKYNNGNYLPIDNGKITLNNLDSGLNIVTVFYKKGSKFIEVANYDFKVSKPWYFSGVMVFGYVLFLFFSLYLYYRWNKMNYLQKIKLNDEEHRHKQEVYQLELEAESKLKIQEYEKYILEAEIRNKDFEVTSKSLSIAKQSEMIDVIEKHLDSESNIDLLKSNIRKSIKINSINKKEWKAFENNLFNSHDEFIKTIANKFSNLTPQDIRLCIYLKMSLTSKEIAPLMNISYRGVELHRYRLRKKLNLNKDINLSIYLTSI